MHALQDLGEELVSLNIEQLSKLPLTDELREAIHAVQNMSKRGARYRQMQYIGRLMRNVDSAPIQEALDLLRNKNNRAAGQFHQLEKWRDALIAGNQLTLNEILEKFPSADRKHLSRLARIAQKEQEEGKPSKASRELFRYLRELQEAEQNTGVRSQESE